MKVKYLQELPKPVIRKRDGAEMTHCLRLTITTDEAVLLSQLFNYSRQSEEPNKPTKSLIRTALLLIAEKPITEETLIAEMAKWRTREALAEELSDSERSRLHNLLNPAPKPVKSDVQPKLPVPKKERRVFIPDPPRR